MSIPISKYERGSFVPDEIKTKMVVGVKKHIMTFKVKHEGAIIYPKFEVDDILKIPYGLNIEEKEVQSEEDAPPRTYKKIVAVFEIDRTNDKLMDIFETPEHTSISGYVNQNDLEVEYGLKGSFGEPKNKGLLKIYSSPEEGSDFVEVDEKKVEVLGEEDDFYQVTTSGKNGVISQMMDDLSELIYKDRTKCGLGSKKSVKEVRALFKPVVYFYRNKEKTEYDHKRNPKCFWEVFRWQEPGKPVKSASFKTPDYIDPETGKKESGIACELEDLTNYSIEGSPVVNIGSLVEITNQAISLRFKVKSMAISNMEEKVERSYQQETLDKFSQDLEAVKRTRELLEKHKSDKRKVDEISSSPTENQEKDLDKLIESTSMEKVEDFPDDIPGLEDD